MLRLFAGGLVLALSLGTLTAQDKKDDKAPAWVREKNGIDLKFEFGKETLKLTVYNGENGAIIDCKTKTDKDGVVKATVTEIEKKGNSPPNNPKVGFEFSFKWKADGDKATLSDLKGEGLDNVKEILEGEYKKK